MPNEEFAKFCIQNVLITQSDRFLGELEVVSIVEIIGPVACNPSPFPHPSSQHFHSRPEKKKKIYIVKYFVMIDLKMLFAEVALETVQTVHRSLCLFYRRI